MPGRGKKKRVVVGGRRSTRLQAKQLNHLPQSDSCIGTPVPVKKVSSWEWEPISCPAFAKSNKLFAEQHLSSLPAKRLKEAGNVSEPRTERPANEHGGSEDDSSSDGQAVINNILKSFGIATTPAQTSYPASRDGKIETFNVTTIPDSASFFATTEPTVASHVSEERPKQFANTNSRTEETLSFGLTEIVGMCDNEDCGTDEVESAAFVTISGTSYRVKEELAPIIRSIIKRHGDIAANHLMKTPEGRSLALENLVEFIQNFKTKKFYAFSQLEIENALALVCDFSDARLDVCWLQRRLEDILEAKKLIKQSSTLKEQRDRIDQVIKEKKIKLAELQQKVNLVQKELEIEQAKAENIKSIVSNAKAKVKFFVDHLPLDGLF